MADTDHSHLDTKYFVDNTAYNCPFCNRRHVRYNISSVYKFDWNTSKLCWAYLVVCHSCEKQSLHLSFSALHEFGWVQLADGKGREAAKFRADLDIDQHVFYSVPTSFFVMDSRIPTVIRELITEAEGCQKMNFLTGASACARKAIYELLVREKAEGKHYEDQIKSLKDKFPAVDSTLFDVLSHIQDMTSDKVHEQSWPKWDAKNLVLINETLKAVLHEIYVVPKEKEARSGRIQQLLEQVRGNKKAVQA